MRKRPFRTAWKTEIFEIVKTNTKPIEVSFLGNLLNSLSVWLMTPLMSQTRWVASWSF